MSMDPYVQLRQYRNGLGLKEYWASAAPSLATDKGPYNVGDLVWNSEPAAGEPVGWICTVAGATGATATFSPLGIIGVTADATELNKLDGVTVATAAINALVQGAAGGYKIARGVRATAAASEDVVTGLATVVACVVSLVGDPSTTHMLVSATVGDQAGAPAAGSIRIKGWKPTANNDVTPIAASAPFGNTAWIAIGT